MMLPGITYSPVGAVLAFHPAAVVVVVMVVVVDGGWS
jgi:hypothetical protein